MSVPVSTADAHPRAQTCAYLQLSGREGHEPGTRFSEETSSVNAGLKWNLGLLSARWGKVCLDLSGSVLWMFGTPSLSVRPTTSVTCFPGLGTKCQA